MYVFSKSLPHSARQIDIYLRDRASDGQRLSRLFLLALRQVYWDRGWNELRLCSSYQEHCIQLSFSQLLVPLTAYLFAIKFSLETGGPSVVYLLQNFVSKKSDKRLVVLE